MNQQFEVLYQIDPSREENYQREMHTSIEISDQEYIEKIKNRFGIKCHSSYEESKDKIELENNSIKEIDIKGKNAKNKSEVIKNKSKKNNPKSNKSAMESI